MNQSKPVSTYLLTRGSKEKDVRDVIFQSVIHKKITASLKTKEKGIIAGTNDVRKAAQSIGLEVISSIPEGSEVRKGNIIATLKGNPKQIAMAEDLLIGLIAKPSGIATAARKAMKLTDGKVTIVCGAWKKTPPQIKEMTREALLVGGVEVRMAKEPFLYLDKNYVRIFGSIQEALENVKGLRDRVKVIQIRGDTDSIETEAVKAAEYGANIIFVDTGNVDDLERVVKVLRETNLRGKVKLAFGGSIKLEDIPKLRKKDVDILDIGRAIIDAPMLDISFDVHSST
jgi:nicotinate-nucleotide pyrophosphorylase (carboxylating)